MSVSTAAVDVFGENWVLNDLSDYLIKNQEDLGEAEIMEYLNELTIFEPMQEGLAALKDKIIINPSSESSEEDIPEPQRQLPAKGVWVVSTSRGVATLHIVGACYRVPGKHYGKWTVVQDPVIPKAFKKACRTCFQRGYPLIRSPAKQPILDTLSDGMPTTLITEEASDSSDSSSD